MRPGRKRAFGSIPRFSSGAGESGPAIEPGRSDESLLIERVTAGAESADRMPPASEGVALDDQQVRLLRGWINQGATAPAEATPADPRRHWAYLPPVRPAVPRHRWPGLVPESDRRLSGGRSSGEGIQPSPPVNNDLLLRRVYLDLMGLPPTREELHEFREDRSPDAYEKVVDRLLASPRYGERWGRHWMDVWRYSDWYGLGEEARYSHPHIWQWRDWIIAALNTDKGYDRMIVEMLAGDELAPCRSGHRGRDRLPRSELGHLQSQHLARQHGRAHRPGIPGRDHPVCPMP